MPTVKRNVQIDNPETLRDIPWLVEHIGLSQTGIRRFVRQGVLPAVRIGRRILFRPSSIARFIEQRETGGDIAPKRGRRARTNGVRW